MSPLIIPNAFVPVVTNDNDLGFGTRSVHIASEPSAETGAVIPPISLATTFEQEAIGKHHGFEYSRTGNPNRAALETLLASLEAGGAFALAYASGSAAVATIIQALGNNTHVLSVNDVYGGTFRFFTRVAGVNPTFMDLESESDENIYNAIRPNTKLIWIETPTNPTLRLISISRIVSIARSHPSNPLVLVDSTFLSPYYQSPLLLGADLVLHSLTKYINGHSDVVTGALILPERHRELYDQLLFLQNASGAIPSPFDCWLAQRGIKTLYLRMRAHGENALRVALYLQSRIGRGVSDVIYPGLGDHPRNALAYVQLSPHARAWIDARSGGGGLAGAQAEGGFPYGGMVSFRIMPREDEDEESGKAHETAERFLTSLRLFTLAESFGAIESLSELPSLMTHGSVPATDRAILGIGDDLIRLSVGIEDAEDLVRDIAQALDFAVYGVRIKSKSIGNPYAPSSGVNLLTSKNGHNRVGNGTPSSSGLDTPSPVVTD